MSGGVTTGRGTRGAFVHHDSVNGELRGGTGGRIAALTSGGAIPETGDYRVVAEPDDTFIGTVNEDWAVESMAGDIFLLGTHSWQIRRVEPGVVRVRDAGDANPTVPFWMGEAPARTAELSTEVSELRRHVDEHLAAGDPDGARAWLMEATGLREVAASLIVDYLAVGRAVLGVTPTQDHLVLERFFDDTGGMQLVLHSPNGGRVNRALGLALRKKFCRSFNFELQAAASDDAIVLSLGPHHSFPLEEVPRYVSSRTVEDTLRQAILDSPMFLSRWRWTLNRSLLILRFRNGRKNPPPIQRMEADDLMAALFPQAAACQENITGPIEIPDHLLVRQTISDTLTEAMDLDGVRGPARADRVRRGDRALLRHHRGIRARPRDHHRAAVRVPRRRGAAEPADECGAAPARAERRPQLHRCAGAGGDRAGARRGRRPSRPWRTTCTICSARSWSPAPATRGGRAGPSWSSGVGARCWSTTASSCGARPSGTRTRSRCSWARSPRWRPRCGASSRSPA